MDTTSEAPQNYFDLPESAKKVCRKQPGFNRSKPMALAVTNSGGIRLFVAVADQWMDASLADIPEWAVLRRFDTSTAALNRRAASREAGAAA